MGSPPMKSSLTELARPLTAEEQWAMAIADPSFRSQHDDNGRCRKNVGLPVEAIIGTLLHRAWLKSGRADPLLDSDAWDGFGLTIQALARVEGLVTPVADTAGIDAAPESLCGCGHDKESHFPACLAPAPSKPHVEFASPLVIEGDTMRREPNYICGCPAFGSPAGASLGKRRAKNAAALRTPKPEGER